MQEDSNLVGSKFFKTQGWSGSRPGDNPVPGIPGIIPGIFELETRDFQGIFEKPNLLRNFQKKFAEFLLEIAYDIITRSNDPFFIYELF